MDGSATLTTSRQPWERQPDETPRAYAAFCAYYQLPPRERSIDAAWRANSQQPVSGKRAPPAWFQWSVKFAWPARALAHDEHLAEQDRLLWEERRAELRRRDWAQADEVRRIVDEALPHAERFIRTQRTHIPAQGDQPQREVITLSFDITGLVRALVEASKLQRLATDEPTEHLKLSGAALDAAIDRELAKLADRGQAGDAGQAATGPDPAPAPNLV